MCVQSLDDSLNSAIHITYRISLRSSSLREPRYPSTGVVVRFVVGRARVYMKNIDSYARWGGEEHSNARHQHAPERRARGNSELPRAAACPRAPNPRHTGAGGGTQRPSRRTTGGPYSKEQEPVRTGFGMDTGNDPSAGSPTETLVRLLLPLTNNVWTASRSVASGEPNASPQSGGLTGSFNR